MKGEQSDSSLADLGIIKAQFRRRRAQFLSVSEATEAARTIHRSRPARSSFASLNARSWNKQRSPYSRESPSRICTSQPYDSPWKYNPQVFVRPSFVSNQTARAAAVRAGEGWTSAN